MRLTNKTDFITGAGMGIGRAACLLFAKEGATIVAVDIDQDAGADTVEQIKKKWVGRRLLQGATSVSRRR